MLTETALVSKMSELSSTVAPDTNPETNDNWLYTGPNNDEVRLRLKFGKN
jgi:hypothetical protein